MNIESRLVFTLRRFKWWLHPAAQSSRRQLRQLKDRYRGKRCFIIGNGPSLNDMDLTKLKGESCFALNRGYLLFDRIGKQTEFLVSVNPHVIRQYDGDFNLLSTKLFVPWTARKWVSARQGVFFLPSPTKSMPPRFCFELTSDWWAGATVTFVAMQLAYYLGFENIYLIGVDHRFATQGEPHKLIESKGEDTNHFSPDYFGDGVEWQLPDLETSELAYCLARYYFSSNGRRIFDATLNGNLQVFPKIAFDTLF